MDRRLSDAVAYVRRDIVAAGVRTRGRTRNTQSRMEDADTITRYKALRIKLTTDLSYERVYDYIANHAGTGVISMPDVSELSDLRRRQPGVRYRSITLTGLHALGVDGADSFLEEMVERFPRECSVVQYEPFTLDL